MRYVDAFNHFFPAAFFEKLMQQPRTEREIGKRVRNIPAIHDLDERMRVVEMFKDKNYSQVLSISQPPLEEMGDPAFCGELSKMGTDGLAELCAKHPHHFTGYVATLAMNDPNAPKEAERAFKNGANGLQIYTNVNGRPLDDPAFFGVFEVAAKHNKPILLHPARGADMPDYKSEDSSKYEIWWTFGWPYETSAAMARLVFSGMFDKLPNLKIVAHHLGAMVPYFEGRVGPGWDQLGKRTSDADYSGVLKGLKKHHLEYFKDFYADSAVFGSKAATECGLAFYGQDKVLFASDCPFDPERGPGYIRDTIRVIESLDLTQEAREKICHRNAEELFGIAPQK
jgi:predicted TIM-barrel fold metal-dependent hydrolase